MSRQGVKGYNKLQIAFLSMSMEVAAEVNDLFVLAAMNNLYGVTLPAG